MDGNFNDSILHLPQNNEREAAPQVINDKGIELISWLSMAKKAISI